MLICGVGRTNKASAVLIKRIADRSWSGRPNIRDIKIELLSVTVSRASKLIDGGVVVALVSQLQGWDF